MAVRVVIILLAIFLAIGVATVVVKLRVTKERRLKNLERGIKMVPMLIHLPPETDDIKVGGRDERDVTNEALSQAQIMYSIIASTLKKGWKSKIYGQKHISFEIIATNGTVKYYAVVPAVITETVKQAIVSAYPTARVEEEFEDNIFSREAEIAGVACGELTLQKDYVYPIATYEESKWDASGALLNAFSAVRPGEGMALQLMFRPTDTSWIKTASVRVQNLRSGNKKSGFSGVAVVDTVKDLIRAPFEPPEAREKEAKQDKPLTDIQQAEIASIENKTRYPGFETLIRVIASSRDRARSESLIGGVVSAFSQFNSNSNNGFKYEMIKDEKKACKDFIFRIFPQEKTSNILNSMELATIFHLPSQNSIPNSQVERQLTKQVDGPVRVPTDGVWLGDNEFRGKKKEIRLSDNDRRRHTYIIGATGMGKSVLLSILLAKI